MSNVLAENVTIRLRVDDAEVRAQLARLRADTAAGALGAGAGASVVAPGGLAFTMAGKGRAGAATVANMSAIAYEGGRDLTLQATGGKARVPRSAPAQAAELAANYGAVRPKIKPAPRILFNLENLTNEEVIEAMKKAGVGLPSQLSNAAVADAYINRQLRVETGDFRIPQRIPTTPVLPTRLQSLTGGGAGGGGALSAFGKRAAAVGWRATKRAAAAGGASLSAAGVMAFSREVSAQRNDYWREVLANPGSTVEYKPYSNAFHSAVDAMATFGTEIGHTLIFGVGAMGLEAAMAQFGGLFSDNARQVVSAATSMADYDFRHWVGLTESDWRDAADKGQRQAEAYNRLRDSAFKQAHAAAEQIANSAEKLGIGPRSRENIADVLYRNGKFRNQFLEDAAHKFYKDNPIGANARQVAPWGVMN